VSKAWAGGSTRAWRNVRASVLASNLANNAGRCTLGIPDVCTGLADTVHHTLGRKVTGDDPRYLQATCAECNGHVGEPNATDPQPKAMTRW
jgi:hypothetical protein